nr:glycerol-3-phosphate dehydrogenase [Piscinibacter sp.]
GLHEAELAHLHANEWAHCADDVLWRRTKLGLHYSAAERDAVQSWCRAHWQAAGSKAAETAWN